MRTRPLIKAGDLVGHQVQLPGFNPLPDPEHRPPEEGGNATGENSSLKAAINKAFKENKIDKAHNNDGGPRFVLAWRMYPNANNTHAQSSSCGCGCSCSG
jgi:hypothetical protein